MKLKIAPRIRFVLAAVVLGIVYYYLLVFLVGWISTHERPGWWLGVFPTRRIGVLGWLIALHTAAVSFAALPVAVAAVIIARSHAILLALTAAVLATATAAIPLFSSTIWPIIWSSEPVFFVTDQVKLIVAVPFFGWVLRAAFFNNRFQPWPVSSSVSQGGSRLSG